MDPGAPGDRYQVVVHVDAPVLADPAAEGQSVVEGGAHVSAETSRRLACDASRVVMTHGAAGHTLDVRPPDADHSPVATTRAPPSRPGVSVPGCHARFGQGHHLRHWASGGQTSLDNLALLCRRHHRAVHEEGYQVGQTGGPLVPEEARRRAPGALTTPLALPFRVDLRLGSGPESPVDTGG